MTKKNKYADRIKEIRKIKGKDLLANPKNWRIHPEHQIKGLEAALGSVGKVGALIAWESPDGLMLLDGHGRVELNPDEEWTVLILDIETQEEADKILMSYDSLGEMAQMNDTSFSELLKSLKEDCPYDMALWSTFKYTELVPEGGTLEGIDMQDFFIEVEEKEKPEKKTTCTCPKCGEIIEIK